MKIVFRIYSVLYTIDDKYVISGSDDTNLRLWKSISNEAVKIVILLIDC